MLYQVWEGMGMGWAEVSFSGVAYPLVDAGLERAVKLGYRRIIVFPYFMFTGILVQRIYAWVDEVQARHPGVEIATSDPLGHDPRLVDIVIQRLDAHEARDEEG